MKKTFYLFVFLFLAGAVYAQKSIQYVSFFPVSVTQNNVNLMQDTTSFSLMGDHSSYNGTTTAYHTFPGGLILGAADKARININTIDITSGNTVIDNMQVDNVLKVVSKGAVKELQLGDKCKSGDIYCNIFSVFANNMNFRWDKVLPDNSTLSLYTIDITVSNLASIKELYLKKGTWSGYAKFLPGLTSGDKLGWVKLRLPGTSTCRKYLVKYTGSLPYDNCDMP